MDWINITIVLSGLLINLALNFLRNKKILNDWKNMSIYLFVWLATAIVLILGYLAPERTLGIMLAFYALVGFSVPQITLNQLTINEYKEEMSNYDRLLRKLPNYLAISDHYLLVLCCGAEK